MDKLSVEILDTSSGALVPATVHVGIQHEAFLEAESGWSVARIESLRRLLLLGTPISELPQHSHWNWARKASLLDLAGYEGFGVECDGEWQGLMLASSQGHLARIPPEAGKPLVYIEFLESAPWNQQALAAGPPRYKGIGIELFEAAIRYSVALGQNGRIGLHSLPDAEVFYRRRGMQTTGPDATYYDLVYYELTSLGAATLLSGVNCP